MTVYCTPQFEDNIKELQKNNSYSNILKDVCSYFNDKNVQELHLTRDIIQNIAGKYSLNKFRIMNSSMNKGKSGSYRCISVVMVDLDSIYLGRIYPKTGGDGIDNLSKEAYKDIAAYIKDCIKSKSLKKLCPKECIFKNEPS
ncbi:MAG: hypothetical protein QM534_09090 [Sediminibacterium sp.]|nr:hypothetical protein [Sediminibacterium sp.]